MRKLLVGIVLLMLVTGALFFLVLSFLRRYPLKVPAPVCFDALVGIDISASNRKNLPGSVVSVSRFGSSLGPCDQLALYRVSSVAEEFYSGPPPSSRQKLQELIIAQVREVPRRRGTFPVKFWEEAALRSAGNGRPVLVLLYSDGENDDMSNESRVSLKHVARRLAANTRVRFVGVVAASPKTRRSLRDAFTPLGHRFALLEPDTVSTAFLFNR